MNTFFHAQLFASALSILLDSLSAWFFCCVIGVFILPIIADRLVFYIPKLLQMTKSGEVLPRGIWHAVREVLMWTSVIIAVYAFLYLFERDLFWFTTISPAALIAWAITIINLFYRLINFDRVVKKQFYYTAYMRHITPEALDAYQKFIEDLDDLYIDDLEMLLNKNLPYMHRQAVLRKRREKTQR